MKRDAPGSVVPFHWDRFNLYELCAQNPPRDARLLRAIYEDGARRASGAERGLILGEDFCGTAALSRAWCGLEKSFRAMGVDIDRETVARARADSGKDERLKIVRSDVRGVRDKVDLIAVLNFSICELHERGELVAYLKHVRSRLRADGCAICDLYGGADAFETGLLDQTVRAPKGHPGAGDRVLYSWEQRLADPLTGRVVNAMHFEVTSKGQKPRVFIDAFVYDWRLWSVPELRDAMAEAGFRSTQVYPRTAGATDSDGNLYTRPIDDPTELGDSFNVFVVGRR